jgi:hypothetical protein
LPESEDGLESGEKKRMEATRLALQLQLQQQGEQYYAQMLLGLVSRSRSCHPLPLFQGQQLQAAAAAAAAVQQQTPPKKKPETATTSSIAVKPPAPVELSAAERQRLREEEEERLRLMRQPVDDLLLDDPKVSIFASPSTIIYLRNCPISTASRISR